MVRSLPVWSVILLSGLLLPAVLAGQHETKAHESLLHGAGVKSDDAALLDLFRKRTLAQAERRRLEDLVRQLGADGYDDRVQASKDLVGAGPRATPVLREALASSDPEVRRRARWCLASLVARPEADLLLAAGSLLAVRRPAHAAAVLLAYLPCAEDETVAYGLLPAIRAVSWRADRLEPALQDAVKARAAVQRTAAAFALGRSGKAGERDLVVPLLSDADEAVRWYAAQALVAGRDRRGVPGLLALVEKGSLERAAEAETLLALVAGETAPPEPLGETQPERLRCSQAWQKWWQKHGARVDLAKVNVDGGLLGLRLVTVVNAFGGGAVWEDSPGRRTRWIIKDVGGPFDIRVLPGGRLLLAEESAKRVTERDRTGKVLWEHRLPRGPLEVQKLPSGNVLVVTNYEIVEVDRAGKVAATHVRDPQGNLFSGQQLPGGNLLYGLYSGEVIEQDRNGKQVRRFAIERPRGLTNIVVLPGGKYLIPYTRSHRIVELDGTGKVTREVGVTSPTCVAVLPGGNLLVGSHILANVREIDRRGNVLWQRRAEGQVFRVRVR
jgi:HEAT repeat protein